MYLLKQYLLLYKGLSNGLRSPPRGGSVRKATNEGNPGDRIDKGNLISMNGQWQYFSKIFTLLALIPRKTRVYTISCQFRCKICKTREKNAKTVLSLLWCFLFFQQEEFAQALAVKPNSDFVENMFSMLDTDRSGYISFRDFLHMVVIFSKGI